MCPVKRCIEKLLVTFSSMPLYQKKQQEGTIIKKIIPRDPTMSIPVSKALFWTSCAQKMPTASLGK